MVHAALRSVGRVVSGADAIIAALRDTIGSDGTLVVYTDWEADMWGEHTWTLDEDKEKLALTVIRPIEATRDHVLPFDPASSRAIRENGALMELVRTLPGARRSANPGASCAAIGRQAEWITSGHAIDYGYGEHSPFAKLVDAGGKVLMLGATNDHMTLLHHAEHLADIPDKRVLRIETPFLVDGHVEWRWIEEFNTGMPVAEGLADDYFATIVEDFLATGKGRRGTVGAAPSVLVEAKEIVPFAVNWIESFFRS